MNKLGGHGALLFFLPGNDDGGKNDILRLTKLIQMKINQGIKMIVFQEKPLRNQESQRMDGFVLHGNGMPIRFGLFQNLPAQIVADTGPVV